MHGFNAIIIVKIELNLITSILICYLNISFTQSLSVAVTLLQPIDIENAVAHFW